MASSGTSGRDIFNGSFLDDFYVGLGGADDIFGNGGNDLLVGDAGNDLIKGGEGDDLLLGGANNDVLISGEREPFEDEGALLGFDIPDGGDDELEGEGGNDLLIVTFDSRDVTIDGGSGVDTLRMGFDQNALQDFLDLFPSVFQTNPDLFTATIDLTGLTGQYRFNGSLLAINLRIDNIENIDGSVFSEFLGGDAGANIINGGAGNDTLEGRGGADTLNGGTGRDRARYDSSPAAVDIDLTRTSSTIAGQQIGGDAQGDRLSSIEDVNGSQFSDLIRGNSAANDLIGNGGNDTLEGRAGADTINGGAGVDTASYESSNAGVNVDLTRATQIGGHAQGDRLTSIERLIGSAFNDTLAGNSGNNFLTGGTGQDTLLGREGSDTLIGGFQNDVLDGGEGTDTASFETATASVQIILRDGTTAGRATHNTGEVDTLISIERAIGSNFADAFFGNSADNRFDGEDGDDVFFSSAGDDSYLGGDGIDTVDYSTEALRSLQVTVSGFTFVNRISVQGGLPDFFDTLIDVERVVGTNFGDTFTSGAAGTIFVGRGGDDVYNVSNSDVDILESVNRGRDTVNASVTYFLRPDAEVEILQAADPFATTQLTLAGSNFANTIIGNDGANTIDGEGGVDILRGRKGNDVYVVGDELDRVEELVGEGADMVLSSVDFVIPSNVEQLLLRDAAVAGIGDGAANVIGGIETGLLGFGGDNLIDGGGGADRIAGGSGHDTFVLRRGEANGDIIADLTGIGSVDSDVLLFVG